MSIVAGKSADVAAGRPAIASISSRRSTRRSGQAFELNRRGYVFLTADPSEASRLRGYVSPTAVFVEGDRAVRARYPFVTDRVIVMLHVRRAGFMDAMKLGRYLAVAVEALEEARQFSPEFQQAGAPLRSGVHIARGRPAR